MTDEEWFEDSFSYLMIESRISLRNKYKESFRNFLIMKNISFAIFNSDLKWSWFCLPEKLNELLVNKVLELEYIHKAKE